jgi:predicted house-cleaning noncanonical NTP pyrophosphatase (MazG superfamily)
MITIHNLGEKSALEVIDFVKEHLLKQGCKSLQIVDDDTRCLYRGPNGTKCAAGCLIPDEDYDPKMEGLLWEELVEKYDFDNPHNELIDRLQAIHDFYEVKEWSKEIIALYLEFK